MTLGLELVREFHETYNCAIRDTPTIDVPEKQLRINLIEEEVEELLQSFKDNDEVETFDALLDIIWVTYGALLTFGLHDQITGEPGPINFSDKYGLIILLDFEISELKDALEYNDAQRTFNALTNILGLCNSAILTFGLPFEEGIQEVARSNRSKLGEDGKPIYRPEDQKVLKGPHFSPPDLKRILNAAQKDTERR